MSVTHTPLDVSAATAAGQTFVSYTVTLRNVGKSELTQTTLAACLVSGSGSGTDCGAAHPAPPFSAVAAQLHDRRSNGALCDRLPSGGSATAELVSRAPTQAGAFRNVIATTVKERGATIQAPTRRRTRSPSPSL